MTRPLLLHSLFWFGEGSFGLWRIRSRLTGFALHLDWRFATDLLAQGAILGLATAAYAWLTTGPIMLLRYGGIAMALIHREKTSEGQIVDGALLATAVTFMQALIAERSVTGIVFRSVPT